ncbi:conjugal transfer protein TraR [Salmonella enterica subsp. enterica serovar Richmond]|nr:conjugal transfer protein TraR [Salmonella enterica subsp. enterica serovar Richmond]ECB7316530.1 conjugal transfer protein TraR [Salmonella enterica subsp. enterica serovar Treforest]ECG5981982.1 conjugal transfer protein TraR [Salmonella enterica subsp. enterica serovar Newport]ECW7884728.1 conjugal transfer protein TraR [Salmonella enterica subsp. enterica serovar Chester]EDE9370757.1 conjugal transfer protein TraR [Salmonella enterica subsp. enterica serovar Typhimurium]EDV1374020.1 con
MTDETERYLAVQRMLEDHSINRIRSRFTGESALWCEDCGAPIPPERRRILQGVKTCIGCQEVVENRQRIYAGSR